MTFEESWESIVDIGYSSEKELARSAWKASEAAANERIRELETDLKHSTMAAEAEAKYADKLKDRLTTANERIRLLSDDVHNAVELNASLSRRVKELETYICNDVRDLKIDLAAERAISDKLEKVLQDYRGQVNQYGQTTATIALAEVAAMRKGEKN